MPVLRRSWLRRLRSDLVGWLRDCPLLPSTAGSQGLADGEGFFADLTEDDEPFDDEDVEPMDPAEGGWAEPVWMNRAK